MPFGLGPGFAQALNVRVGYDPNRERLRYLDKKAAGEEAQRKTQQLQESLKLPTIMNERDRVRSTEYAHTYIDEKIKPFIEQHGYDNIKSNWRLAQEFEQLKHGLVNGEPVLTGVHNDREYAKMLDYVGKTPGARDHYKGQRLMREWDSLQKTPLDMDAPRFIFDAFDPTFDVDNYLLDLGRKMGTETRRARGMGAGATVTQVDPEDIYELATSELRGVYGPEIEDKWSRLSASQKRMYGDDITGYAASLIQSGTSYKEDTGQYWKPSTGPGRGDNMTANAEYVVERLKSYLSDESRNIEKMGPNPLQTDVNELFVGSKMGESSIMKMGKYTKADEIVQDIKVNPETNNLVVTSMIGDKPKYYEMDVMEFLEKIGENNYKGNKGWFKAMTDYAESQGYLDESKAFNPTRTKQQETTQEEDPYEKYKRK